jgi:hypothetical protein
MAKNHTQQKADNSKHKGKAVGQENLPSAESKGLTSFIIDLYLDEAGRLNRTKVMHVGRGILMQAKGGIEEEWKGWEGPRLLDFIIKHSGLRHPAAKADMPKATTTEEQRESKLTPHAIPVPTTTAGSVPLSDQPIEPPPAPISKVASTGKPSLRGFEVIPVDSKTPSWALQADQQFDIRLTLDFTDLEYPKKTLLTYTATVYAKKVKSRLNQSIKEAHGSLMPTEKTTINIGGLQLKEGSYRLQATVGLTSQPEHQHDTVLLSGEKLLEVY